MKTRHGLMFCALIAERHILIRAYSAAAVLFFIGDAKF